MATYSFGGIADDVSNSICGRAAREILNCQRDKDVINMAYIEQAI
jgi:hypothetical protein